MKLEPTASDADVAELQVRLRSLTVDQARLEALTTDAARPKFPSKFMESYPELVRQARTRFNVRRRRHVGEVLRQKQAVAQRKQEITEINTRIRGSQANFKLVNEQIRISDELMKDSLTNRFQHLDLLKESRKLRGSIDTDRASLQRARLALSEADAELDNIQKSSSQLPLSF